MKTNLERARRSLPAVALYQTSNGSKAEALCDLLCDLKHLGASDPSYGTFEDALRLATAHFRFETRGDVLPSGALAEVPTVVIDIDGGAVHDVRANMPMRVVILDADIEGAETERIQTIEGVRAYVHDRRLQPGSENISAEGVQTVLLELGDEPAHQAAVAPDHFIEELRVALPGNHGYEKGFRDALESVALALAASASKAVLRLVIDTAMDAYTNNCAPGVLEAESVGTLATCYFEAYAAHSHGEGPGFACLTPDAAFLTRLRTAVRQCDNLGLNSVSIDRAPDSWGPDEIANDLQLVDSELIVTGEVFWFQANVKNAGYHVETRAQSVEDFCRAVESTGLGNLFFGENDDLESEVLDALGTGG